MSYLRSRRFLSDLIVFVLLVAAYFGTGKLGLATARVNPSASPIWAPTGIALAVVLVRGYRMWPAVLVGAFLVNVTTAGSVLTSLAIGMGNTCEALIGAYFVNRFAGGLHVFDTPLGVFKFTVLAGLIATLVSATVGVTTLAAAGMAAWLDYGPVWVTWWMGDAVGAIVATPAIVLWGVHNHSAIRPPGRVELLLWLGMFFLSGFGVFGGLWPSSLVDSPRAFMALPVMVWAGYRFPQRMTALATLGLSAIAVWGTLIGLGPFGGEPQNQALLLEQSFMAIVALTATTIGAAVSERNRAEQAVIASRRDLQITRDELQAIFDSAGDTVLVVRPDGLIVRVNPAFEAQTGYLASEVQGSSLLELLLQSPSASDEAGDVSSALHRGDTWQGFYHIRCKNGALCEIAVTVAPLGKAQGADRASVITWRDVTALKEVERTKDAFVANVSHELRTPLTSITLYHRLLAENPDRVSQYIATLQRETKRLATIVEDLLRFSRMDLKEVKPDLKPVDVNCLIENHVADRQIVATEKGLKLKFTPGPEVPLVQCDEDLIGQVLSILLTNAFSYTPPGGEVIVSSEREERDSRAGVTFSISDTGPGIPPEEQSQLFSRFTRGRAALEAGIPGTGLGLSIASEVIGLHTGRVEVESSGRPGEGAKFTVWLPITSSSQG